MTLDKTGIQKICISRGYRICGLMTIIILLLGVAACSLHPHTYQHIIIDVSSSQSLDDTNMNMSNRRREEIIRETNMTVSVKEIDDQSSNLSVSNQFTSATVERRLCSAKYVDFAQSLLPVTRTDVLGFICTATAVIMSAVGGIGAGGILIPIFILVMGFRPKHAIPLSAVTVLGGSITNNLANKRKRHPLVDRPIIDWDLILAVEPLSLIGALLGTFINKIFPEGILGVVLVLFLVIVAHLTLKRAYTSYRRENSRCLTDDGIIELPSPSVDLEADIELTRTVVQNPGTSYHLTGNDDETTLLPEASALPTVTSESSSGVITEFRQELENLEIQERKTLRPSSLILATTVLVVLFVNIMKGGEAFKSPLGFDCGSPEFWSANLLMIVWLFTTYFHARVYLMSQIAKKDRVSFKYVMGDIHWDQKSIVIFPILNFFAGLFGGMFGVGGGVIKVPVLLSMGVHPSVASATSCVSIFFTSSISFTSYVVFGLLVEDYAAVCFFIGLCGTYVGRRLFSLSIKMSGLSNLRESFMIFSVGGVVLLSAVLMTIEELKHAMAGCELAFGTTENICGNS